MEREDYFVPEESEPNMKEINVTKLAPGLGFGEGSISTVERLDKPDDLTSEDMNKVDKAVHSPEILVPIEADDDGCGDGRGVKRTFLGLVEKAKSLHRSKVFGGGLTMAVAAVIGMGKGIGKKLADTFSATQEDLDQRGIDYGAHTADHAEGPDSGCGAIDKSPVIIGNAIKYKDKIESAIGLLTGGDDTNELDRIFNNYASYYEEIKDDDSYRGKDISEKITNKDKVNKELEGGHLEVAIVINTVKGKTVDQGYVRRVTNGKAQVFAVDEWRLREIADNMYDSEADSQRAYLSMLVYTLATAGTLTKGDLPVYVISQQPQLVAA